ncbi:MAG TPA: response regulator transcription factor [Burkholderiaceae bacterium]|nr:response regulator transcription factor [Burkholderiaceae bacterium]
MIRVAIVDDHALIRRGLRDSLTEAGDIRVVGEASDYGELRQLLRETEFDVLLLDINLPGRSGLDVLHSLAEESTRIRVLVITMYPEDQYAIRALKAGAMGYLNKSADPSQIVAAVRTLHAGRKFITPAIAEALAERLSVSEDETPHERLSDREFQTMIRLASGQRLSDIAAEFNLSPKTVSVYRARVLEKMAMQSNADLTAYCLRNGLID